MEDDKMNLIRLFIITFLTSVGISHSANGQFLRQLSLANIDTVEVVVNIDEDSEYSRLENQLKNRTELRLRQNDIRIGASANTIATLSFNVLMLDIGFKGGDNFGKAARYDLELTQISSLDQIPLPIFSITWQSSGITITSENDLEATLRNILNSSLDEFLNDYISIKQELESPVELEEN
ncbi:hypothetical protein ACKGJO_09280 [Gracilimonas sp. Q87]|uniref:hypothetical protein n=1 Tax=Gracilimonas sp. Q87 TaxID=3384766 RepID=UPI00398410EA